MTYKLGNRSKERLQGVDERMQTVVRSAIGRSSQDFSVICGLRTIEEQRKLVAKGASQTMKSKHIDGLAVDLAAYEDGIRWELNLYDEIADAMREAAKDCGVKIRWGAAWHIDDFGAYDGTAEEAMNEYIDLRRSQGRRPFIDAPHFEIME
jgi:peptidoglycan L-alanyl-D-glutamate endopeptidase CwlK